MGLRFFHNNNAAGGTELWVQAGQSNCGRTQTTGSGAQFMNSGQQTLYNKTYPKVKVINPASGATTFVDMNAGVNTILDYSGEFGSELSFFESFTDSKIRYFIKGGVGNTYLATQWNAVPNAFNASVGTLFTNLKNQINSACNQLSILGKNDVKFKGILWIQGENDAITSGHANAYQTHLQSFKDELDAWWINMYTIYGFPVDLSYKFLVAKNNGQYDASQVYNTTVQAKQSAFVAANSNARLIDTLGYSFFDGVHYDATSQIQFGIDLFNAYNS